MRPASTLLRKAITFFFLAVFAMMIAFILFFGMYNPAKAQQQKTYTPSHLFAVYLPE
jgi:hypothetical protein